MTRKTNFWKACLCALSTVVTGSMLNAEEINVLPGMNAPKLDGIIEQNEWNLAYFGKLVDISTGKDPVAATQYYMGCDKDNLYIAFNCEENNVADMMRKFTHIEERDNALYKDDCVEIFVDPFGTIGSDIIHFVVNSNGILYDSMGNDITYHSGIKAVCKVGKDRWVVELSIPFADLCVIPKGGEVLNIGLGRERYPSPIEYTCLKTGNGGFMDRSRFLPFRPQPDNAAIPAVTFKYFGSEVCSEICFENSDAADKQRHAVCIEMIDDKMKAIRKFNLKTKEDKPTVFEYRLGKKKTASGMRFSVLSDVDKSVEYSNIFLFPKKKDKGFAQAMAVSYPLFEELLGKEQKKNLGFYGMQWCFGLGHDGRLQHFTRQFGIGCSSYEAAKMYRATGMANYMNATMIDWGNETIHGNELKAPLAIMPRVLDPNVKCGLPHELVMVPEIRKQFMDDVRKLATSPNVRIMTMCDEVSECIELQLIKAFQAKPNSPELLAVDKEIKEKYGQGKYGIPTSFEEQNPIAWIAWRRYLNDVIVDVQKEAYALAKSLNPNIIVISDDPVGNQSKIYSFSDWKGNCDIVTHQLYPRNNPNLDCFGFLTRYLKDLTGKRDVWPCPHVEEYGACFTPTEVLYKLSETVRNGATGFHFYLADTTGSSSQKKHLIHEMWGAPDRYAVEIGAQKLMAKLPYLNFPASDAAVFTATDSLRAQVGVKSQPTRDMYLHTLMGYGAGVWYKFINEKTLDNLAPYKFIATAECEYVDKAAVKSLQSYVENGGTLLILNPRGFSTTPTGESLAAERLALTGIASIGSAFSPETFAWKGQTYAIPGLRSLDFNVKGAEVVAKFDNGKAAIIKKQLGKGQVYTMAFEPCILRFIVKDEWKQLFKSFAQDCGAKVDCSMWHFQLPTSLLPKDVEIPGSCITNNFIAWKCFKPTRPNDSELSGSYAFSPEPNVYADAKKGEISFSEGKLTDRPKAAIAESAYDGKGSGSNWAVAWKTETPVTISCKWSEEQPIRCVKLFVDGIWRNAEIKIGGKSYAFPIPQNFNDNPIAVKEFVMELPKPVNAKELQIVIAAGKAETFCISEMEIWSTK